MKTSLKRMLVGAGALALLFAASRAARADESEAARLFREGRALMLEGRFAEACPMIAESQRLEPHVGTLLNLAACHERSGKVATAWVEYEKALTAARTEGQADRERLAQERIAVLEPRVPWLTVSLDPSVAQAEGLTVSLDGAPLPPALLQKEMPVDPGEHTVTAMVPGHKSFQEQFVLHESEHKTVGVTSLATEPPMPAAPADRKDNTVVVEPTPGPAPAKPADRARWVFEAGFFVGFLGLNTERAYASNPESIGLYSSMSTSQRSNCNAVGCTYSLADGSGAVIGVNFFGGYAVSDQLQFGGRLLVGPRIQTGGGSLVAIGPSASLRASPAIWVGASLFLGTASAGGYGTVKPPAPWQVDGGRYDVSASTDLAAGASVDVALRVLETPRGMLLLNATPLFLLGSNGSAVVFPLGVAYRFH
jgi:hypothetical protein